MEKELLALALVNLGMASGMGYDEAWTRAETLAARGGAVRELADEMRESVPVANWLGA